MIPDSEGRSGTRHSARRGKDRAVGRKGLGGLAIPFLALILAGCAHSGTTQPTRGPTTVPLSDAMIFPAPGGPGLLSVVQTVHVNAVRQDIALATDARTPGENRIAVTRFARSQAGPDDGALEDAGLAGRDLVAEASAAWPGVQMTLSPYFTQNAYGPFGYAVGRSPNRDTCLYAFQRMGPGLRARESLRTASVVIQLQVCDAARTEEQLLSLMYTLRLTEPAFEPVRADIRIGQPGVPIRPVVQGRFVSAIETPAAAPAPRPSPAPAAPAAPVPVAEPVPTGPLVPPPPGTTPAPAPAPASVLVPPPPAAGAS